MKSATRTLVTSPPELWELIDQPDRMQGLMSALVGRATEINVYERQEGESLGWEARSDTDDEAWIKVEIAEKGWGTHVELSAENRAEPTKLDGWLEAVLDELATPEKRPFRDMAGPDEPQPVEAAPEPEPSEPAAVPEPAPAPPERRRRRFFGF